MTGNRTFTIIKPDAVKAGKTEDIKKIITEAGFKIVSEKPLTLSEEQAQAFYAVHKGKEFYDRLIAFMTSGPIVAIILEKENAVADYRKLIGSTDPEKAEEGTIRKKYATTTTFNAVHGSDSDENARIEGEFFFPTTA